MRPKTEISEMLFFCLLFILLYACRSNIEDSLLLQKQEYKLWQIVDEKPEDCLEWIYMGNLKLESFWNECDWATECCNFNKEYDYIMYWNYIKPAKKPRLFKKKGVTPEFLYFNRDGYVSIVYFDRSAGNFFEKQDAEISGKWEIKNDSILVINNNYFLYKQTGKNPATLIISNLSTGKTMQLMDSSIPYVCGHQITWTEEDEKLHRRKCGFGIKESPLLQGDDVRLWREENKIGHDDGSNLDLLRGNEYFERLYYYCGVMYFDKYGRYADLDFSGVDWQMLENNFPFADDLFSITSWYPNGNDSTFCGYNTYSISYTHPDTLNLRNVETGETIRYIAINLPLKSKWKESRKR